LGHDHFGYWLIDLPGPYVIHKCIYKYSVNTPLVVPILYRYNTLQEEEEEEEEERIILGHLG
jgi:hypothetical protein